MNDSSFNEIPKQGSFLNEEATILKSDIEEIYRTTVQNRQEQMRKRAVFAEENYPVVRNRWVTESAENTKDSGRRVVLKSSLAGIEAYGMSRQ